MPDRAASLLAVCDVSKSFAVSSGAAVKALDGVSLDVHQGEFVAVIGPSGCGKTTLFGIIGGLVTDFDGEVLINGESVRGGHSDIGMVFQEESTFPWRTTLQNVMFPMEITDMPTKEREERARHFVRLVGLEGFEDRYPAELSGGMKQRTAIARTLAYEPKILLMDEPFGALDEQTRMLLGDKILQIWRELEQTTLLITHNITEAVQLADRVVVMTFRPGRIKETITIDLPRPRTSEIIATPAFGAYVARIWQLLREEALRGMTESENAARK
jgi:NitT/TauT family transport system ATP-binding protein